MSVESLYPFLYADTSDIQAVLAGQQFQGGGQITGQHPEAAAVAGRDAE